MIYFDNAATTKPSEGVTAAMTAALTHRWANPSSVHGAGNDAHRALEEARDTVASAIGLRRRTDGRIIFTSGGTEANNLAMTGAVRAKERKEKNGTRGVILISDGEHPSVDSPAAAFEAEGFTVKRIPTRGGVLDLDFVRANAADVIYASIMFANNETGAVYDVRQAAEIIRAASPAAVIHSDCVQAFMKMKLSPTSLGVDMLTVSAHKINGPKGVGALYVSEAVVKSKRLVPVTRGGSQEDEFRPGTENFPGIMGFARAVREAAAGFDSRQATVSEVRRALEAAVAKIDGIKINRPSGAYLGGVMSITLPMIKSETMLNALSAKGICVSAGSACSARAAHISRPMQAFGLSAAEADSVIRVSISHENTAAEAEAFAAALADSCAKLQRVRR